MNTVDVIVPAHDPSRPVDRPVGSVLENADVVVTVVAHNCGAEPISARLQALADDPRVRVIELNDGIRSPAGPMNHGIANTDNPWLAVLGSDDSLAPGALDSWRAQAQRHDAEVVLAQRSFDGVFRESMRRRPLRRHRLDVVADGVFYATAPLGLLSRAAVKRSGARMTEGLPTGEDLGFSLALYANARGIEYGGRDAAYQVHSDQAERATTTARPLAALIAAPALAAESGVIEAMAPRLATAAAVAVLRVHVLAQLKPEVVKAAENSELQTLAECVQRLGGPGLARFGALSMREHRLTGAAASGDRLRILGVLTEPVSRRATWLTANPTRLLAPEAPLNWLISRTITARVSRR